MFETIPFITFCRMQCLSGYRHTLFLLLFVSYGVYLFMLHETRRSVIHRFIIRSIRSSLAQCHWPLSVPLKGECTCFFYCVFGPLISLPQCHRSWSVLLIGKCTCFFYCAFGPLISFPQCHRSWSLANVRVFAVRLFRRSYAVLI